MVSVSVELLPSVCVLLLDVDAPWVLPDDSPVDSVTTDPFESVMACQASVRRLAEQNKQIRSQMDELAAEHARQDKIRQEFTANVSHELKTPLTSISGFADLMRNINR